MTVTKSLFVPKGGRSHGVNVSKFILTLVASTVISYHLGVHSRRYFHVDNVANQASMANGPDGNAETVSVNFFEMFLDDAKRHDQAILENTLENEDEDDAANLEEDEGGASTMELVRHFVFDLEAVPNDMIASIDQVTALLEEVVEECDTEILMKECYDDSRSISCVGILGDKGHASLHVWPHSGVVLLDVMLPDARLMDSIEEIYAIFHPYMPNYFDIEESLLSTEQGSNWFVRPRAGSNYNDDYDEAMAVHGEMKYKVASVKTKFQQVDVVDVKAIPDLINFESFKIQDPEYIEANPNLFAPDRALYLDGIVQSTLQGNAAYHEALVQPSMFAHPNPKRVAIIGGGECATLREVLKHNTVEKVVMIEIDPGVIEVAKYALPMWNDCSHFEGSSRYCMDDPRAEIHNDDAFAWFIDRYLANNNTGEETLFDIIIVDALDPQNVVEFAEALYGDNSFLAALYNALTEDGILITQVGNEPYKDDPPEQMTVDANRLIFAQSLTRQGFKSIVDYSEEHTGFEEPWYFYAAFKELSTRANWMANEAEINLKMRKRAIGTIDGSSPYEFFDGATMVKYQFPSQASVDLFCRREPIPEGCDVRSHGFNPETVNFPEEFFNVTISSAGLHAGRGVVAKRTIPQGSYLMLETMAYPVTVDPPSSSLIARMSDHDLADEFQSYVITAFVYGYGYSSAGFGDADKIEVDSGLMTFVNHGCHGASNLGDFPNITTSTVNPFRVPNELHFYRNQGPAYVFNPAIARDTTSRAIVQNRRGDIQSGEELLENYYENFSSFKDWAEHVRVLHDYCAGGIGEVEQYQIDESARNYSDQEGNNSIRHGATISATCSATLELSSMVDVIMGS